METTFTMLLRLSSVAGQFEDFCPLLGVRHAVPDQHNAWRFGRRIRFTPRYVTFSSTLAVPQTPNPGFWANLLIRNSTYSESSNETSASKFPITSYCKSFTRAYPDVESVHFCGKMPPLARGFLASSIQACSAAYFCTTSVGSIRGTVAHDDPLNGPDRLPDHGLDRQLDELRLIPRWSIIENV